MGKIDAEAGKRFFCPKCGLKLDYAGELPKGGLTVVLLYCRQCNGNIEYTVLKD